jgi:hypothetical protein
MKRLSNKIVEMNTPRLTVTIIIQRQEFQATIFFF